MTPYFFRLKFGLICYIILFRIQYFYFRVDKDRIINLGLKNYKSTAKGTVKKIYIHQNYIPKYYFSVKVIIKRQQSMGDFMSNKIIRSIIPYITLMFIFSTIILIAGCQPNNEMKISDIKEKIHSMQNEPIETTASNLPAAGSPESKPDVIETLTSQGYDAKDIESAELYIKRVLLLLNEINTFSAGIGSHNEFSTDPFNSQTEDLLDYSSLASKIDENKALYFAVMLQNSFNGIEGAFDEYLSSLQLEIDLSLYLNDNDTYNKIKKEKLSVISSSGLINVNQIERKSLENLRKLNEANKNNFNRINPITYNPAHNSAPGINNPQPILPDVDIPKPVDPAEEIRKKTDPTY